MKHHSRYLFPLIFNGVNINLGFDPGMDEVIDAINETDFEADGCDFLDSKISNILDSTSLEFTSGGRSYLELDGVVTIKGEDKGAYFRFNWYPLTGKFRNVIMSYGFGDDEVEKEIK